MSDSSVAILHSQFYIFNSCGQQDRQRRQRGEQQPPLPCHQPGRQREADYPAERQQRQQENWPPPPATKDAGPKTKEPTFVARPSSFVDHPSSEKTNERSKFKRCKKP